MHDGQTFTNIYSHVVVGMKGGGGGVDNCTFVIIVSGDLP